MPRIASDRYLVFPLPSCIPLKESRARIRMRKTALCAPIICPPFGESCTCMSVFLSRLKTNMDLLESFLPGSSELLRKNRPTFADCSCLFAIPVPTAKALNDETYYSLTSQLSFLARCIDILKDGRDLRQGILLCLPGHTANPSILIAVNGLTKLLEVALSVQRTTLSGFWRTLDDYPDASREQLAHLISSVCDTFILIMAPSEHHSRPVCNILTSVLLLQSMWTGNILRRWEFVNG